MFVLCITKDQFEDKIHFWGHQIMAISSLHGHPINSRPYPIDPIISCRSFQLQEIASVIPLHRHSANTPSQLLFASILKGELTCLLILWPRVRTTRELPVFGIAQNGKTAQASSKTFQTLLRKLVINCSRQIAQKLLSISIPPHPMKIDILHHRCNAV